MVVAILPSSSLRYLGEGASAFRLSWPFILHPSSFILPRSPRVVGVLAAWLVVGLPAAYAMTSYTPTTLSDAGDIIGDGKVVVLEPEKWIGKRFPLLDCIDIGDKLKSGKWLVLLYHHDCPKCLKVIPRYEGQARESSNAPAAPRVALIQIPPFGTPEPLPLPSDTSCVLGQLSDKKEWFVETPAVLLLRSGMVSPMTQEQYVPHVETVSATPEARPVCATCEQSTMAPMKLDLAEGR